MRDGARVRTSYRICDSQTGNRMELTSLTPEHARQVAEIHAEGQVGTFLTRLGLDFLTTLYAAMPESPWVFGSVVMDGEIVAGVGVVALDTDQFFRDVKRRHWPRLLWCVARQVLRHPSLIGEIVQSVRYPAKLSAPPGEAEILFLGIRRAYMRQGIAPDLLDHLLDEAYRRGCPSATATIDRRNRAIRWMIAALPGVYVDREIELHGETMLIYRASLPLGEKE
jgi:GNAT superfamily N-acetyltransferase